MFKLWILTVTATITKCMAQTENPCPEMNFFFCENLSYKARVPECNACVLSKDVGNNPATDFCYLKSSNRSCVDSATSRSEKFNKADGTQAILFTINMAELRGEAALLQFKDSGGKVQFGLKVFRKIPLVTTSAPKTTAQVTTPEASSNSSVTVPANVTSTTTPEIYDPSPNADLVKFTLTNEENSKVIYSIPFFSLPTDNDRAEFRIAMVTNPEGKKAFSVTIGNHLRMISALSDMKTGIQFSDAGLTCTVNMTENGSNATSSSPPEASPPPTDLVGPSTPPPAKPKRKSNEDDPETATTVSAATPSGNKTGNGTDFSTDPCISSRLFSLFRIADLMYADMPKGLTIHGSFCRSNCTVGFDQSYYYCATSWWLGKEGELRDWDLCGPQDSTAHGYKCSTECKQNRGTYYCKVDINSISTFGLPATTLCGGIEDCSDTSDYCTPSRPLIKP